MTPDELLKKLECEMAGRLSEGGKVLETEHGTHYKAVHTKESKAIKDILTDTIAMFRTLREKMKKEGDNPCMIAAVINNALPTEETLKEYEK